MVSIIIPTYNGGETISRLLAVLRKSPDVSEVVIIDSSSSDNTVDIAKTYGAKVIEIAKEQFNHGATRTMGGKAAQGDILVFMTQDAIPVNEHAIGNLIKPLLQNDEIAAAYGRQLPYPDATPFAAHLRQFNYPPTSCVKSLEDRRSLGIKAAFLSNVYAAYKRTCLEEIGWFKDGLIMAEDTYAGAKLLLAGYKIAYVTEAEVLHSHNFSMFQDLRRYFRIGAFHRMEDWILEEFGKAEGEGFRFIRSEMSFLLRQNKYHLLPEALIRNFIKYAGYKLGQNYMKIPEGLRRRLGISC